MRRDLFGPLFLIVLIVMAAGLAGVTRFPDAAWVQAVSRAAVFGPWIARLAELYRRPAKESLAPEDPGDEAGGPEIVYRLDLERFEARPQVWVPEGTGLFAEPGQASSRLATLRATANLNVFDRQGDWYMVRYEEEKGWVRLADLVESTTPPLGSAPEPPLPLPARPPDPEVLASARALLGEPSEVDSLGPYRLYTDVRDRALLSNLAGLADQLEPAYSERYGLEPLPGAAEAVVLFESPESYQRFRHADPETRAVRVPGLVRRGVVATYAGDRSYGEIAATVVHELTHLLNRRALGPALPPWLDEGLADDLGQSRIEGRRLTPGRLGGSFRRSGNRIDYGGGRAAAIELQRALSADSLPTIEELVRLDWAEFRTAEGRALRYGQSSFFVRWLLDAADPELASGFRAFLRDVSEGRALTPEALGERLDRPWSLLDRRLASFVKLQAIDEGAPSGESGSSSRQAIDPSS